MSYAPLYEGMRGHDRDSMEKRASGRDISGDILADVKIFDQHIDGNEIIVSGQCTQKQAKMKVFELATTVRLRRASTVRDSSNSKKVSAHRKKRYIMMTVRMFARGRQYGKEMRRKSG